MRNKLTEIRTLVVRYYNDGTQLLSPMVFIWRFG